MTTAPRLGQPATYTDDTHAKLTLFLKQANSVILDKENEIRLTLCCLLANGHLLLEDVPGVGKTTLVKTLGSLLNLRFSRIQFTNDLLPADITGTSVFDQERKTFVFHPGPIFSQLVLADELNRATPKTQSATLQAMEEHDVSIDGVNHKLPNPFFLIATQNPRQQIGTFPLPESQLDRFLMRLELGYPGRQAERLLLLGEDRRDLLLKMEPVLNPEDLVSMAASARKVHTSEALIAYIQDLVDLSRARSQGGAGLSPRGALALLRASQAWAYMDGRNLVLPEDVQAVAVAVMSHRLCPPEDIMGETGRRIAEDIVASVKVD